MTDSYPDSTVMQSDLLDLGANPFEIFTGINGWSGNGTGTVYYLNLSCMGVAVTLFNATPADLWMNYTTKQGEVSGPGEDFGAVFAQGFSSTYTRRLERHGLGRVAAVRLYDDFFRPG